MEEEDVKKLKKENRRKFKDYLIVEKLLNNYSDHFNKNDLFKRWIFLRVSHRLEERRRMLRVEKIRLLMKMQLSYHLKSSTKKLTKLFKVIPEEFENLFHQKLSFCISNIEKYFKRPDNEYIVLSSSTFKDTFEQDKTQSITTTVGKILALSKWDGIDLLPHNFLNYFKDISHRYSPNERVRALYMIAKTGTKKKEVKQLDELVETFRNNFSVLNILERKLISWTGNNDFCSSYIACAHFMKNILASGTIQRGIIGIRSKKMQHFYETLELVSKEIQQRTRIKLLDDKFDGNITKELMKEQAVELLQEFDGSHHSLFSLFSPFIHELFRIITIKTFFKNMLLAKKQKTLQKLTTDYYQRMNEINHHHI